MEVVIIIDEASDVDWGKIARDNQKNTRTVLVFDEHNEGKFYKTTEPRPEFCVDIEDLIKSDFQAFYSTFFGEKHGKIGVDLASKDSKDTTVFVERDGDEIRVLDREAFDNAFAPSIASLSYKSLKNEEEKYVLAMEKAWIAFVEKNNNQYHRRGCKFCKK